MSLVFNMIGGGGGGFSVNNALLHISCDAGSTITLSKGGVVVETLGPDEQHVNSEDSTLAEWYYSISPQNYGEWEVAGVFAGIAVSNTVTVSTNAMYDVDLWKGQLYSYGTEFTRITGGWTTRAEASGGTFDKNAQNMYVLGPANKATEAITTNRIDLTEFTTLTAVTGTGNSGSGRNLLITNSTSYTSTGIAHSDLASNGVTTLNVTGYSGSYYVGLRSQNGNGIYIYSVYLTK